MADTATPRRPRRKRLALHWQIIIGLVLGVVVGLIINLGWTGGTWAAMGVDNVPAFLDKERTLLLPDGKTFEQVAIDAGLAHWADLDPTTLEEPDLAQLGIAYANADANFLAHAARFVRNLNGFVGDLFMRSLRFIAVPIVLFSLIVGVSTLNNLTKLSRIGGKTIAIYLATTAVAISLGLVIANVVRPGAFVKQETRDKLLADYQDAAQGGVATAEAAKGMDAWERLVDLVAANPFQAIAEGNMLQIVFLALFIGIGLSLVSRAEAGPVVAFCEGMTAAVIKLVELLMLTAPIAVFALIVNVVADLGLEVLGALAVYSLCVVGGLALMVFAVYPLVLKVFTGVGPGRFYRAIAPAQLLAFSSASSSATLPVTMECVEKRLGVSDEVSSFVLPLGATINMDGTALYQGVAAVFIAQLYSMNLGLGDQLAIVGTATLASIGTAGVPGAGVIMLVIVLQSVGVPLEGIAAILGVDRLLDMARTTCNITGDAMVATVVAGSEGELAGVEEVERRLGVDESPRT